LFFLTRISILTTDHVNVIALIEESLLEEEKVPELLLFLLHKLSLQGHDVQNLVRHLDYWEVLEQYHVFTSSKAEMDILGEALVARMNFWEDQDHDSLCAFRESCDTVYVQELLRKDPELFLRVDKVVVMATAQMKFPKKVGIVPPEPSKIGAFFRQLRKKDVRGLLADMKLKGE
jgi:hypothetical protein